MHHFVPLNSVVPLELNKMGHHLLFYATYSEFLLPSALMRTACCFSSLSIYLVHWQALPCQYCQFHSLKKCRKSSCCQCQSGSHVHFVYPRLKTWTCRSKCEITAHERREYRINITKCVILCQSNTWSCCYQCSINILNYSIYIVQHRFGDLGGGSKVGFSLFSFTHQSTWPCLHISGLGVLLIEKEVTEFVIEMRIIDILVKSRRKPLIQ